MMNHNLSLKSPFEKIGEYFLSLIEKRDIGIDKKLEKDWYSTINIDDRVKKSSYFYLPDDVNVFDMNCFEINVNFYLALKYFYPKSNPSLVNLLLDESNLHSGVLFTHENQVHFADPIQKIFGPAQIQPEKIFIQNNLVSKSRKSEEVKFKDIFKVSDEKLEDIIKHLKSNEGIVNFFYGSGQLASFIPEWPFKKELFIHIDDEYNIFGQIRIKDVCPSSKENLLINIKYNPFTYKYIFTNFTYTSSFWKITKGKKLLTTNKSNSDSDNSEIVKKVSDYLNKTKMSFESNSNYSHILESIYGLPKDFIHAKKMKDNFINYYLDYVWENDGGDFGIKYSRVDLISSMFTFDDQPKKEIISKERTKKLMFKEINDRTRFQLFRLAYDFKKYSEIISRNI